MASLATATMLKKPVSSQQLTAAESKSQEEHIRRIAHAKTPEERLAVCAHTFGEFGGVNMSIEASTTFTVMEPQTLPDIFNGKPAVTVGIDEASREHGKFLYGRHFNPTVLALGRQIAAIEGTESAYPCASGMAAISCTLMQLCKAGDHIVSSDTVYGGSFAFIHDLLPDYGIHSTFVNIADLQAVEKAITPNTKVLYTEVLANPTLRVADIRALSAIAKKHGVQLVVDNTFTPLIFSPAAMGADVVIHSMTKFLNGASDIIAGVVCGKNSFIRSLMDLHKGMFMLFGPTMDPRIAFEVSLRIPHLSLRMKEHSRRALFFAEELEKLGLTVGYPGLKSHPQHELFTQLMTKEYGYGGLLTLDLKTKDNAFAFMERLQNYYGFGFMAVSLGYFDTLMSASASSTSSELSPEDLEKAGIKPGLVRMSIGFTGTMEQRFEQLKQALVDCKLL